MPTANENGFLQSNDYITKNSITQTNPYANEANAVKLYGIDTMTDRHSIAFSYAITTGGDQISFSPTTGSSTATDYLKFRIQDESGNEAYSTTYQSSAPTAAIAVNTAALNPADDWTVLFQTSNNSGRTKVKFQFKLGSGQISGNASGTVSYTLS